MNEVAAFGSEEERMYQNIGISFIIELRKQMSLHLPGSPNGASSRESVNTFVKTLNEMLQVSKLEFEDHADYMTDAEIIGEAIFNMRGKTGGQKFNF